MKKRFLAAALTLCLLLSGCGPSRTEPVQAETPTDGPVIAYVPLDDRPDNVERVKYLAESMGYTLEMPEADCYRTRLGGQPRNTNGTQYGDRAALYEWVLAQEAAGCDRYILSMDQMLSGGLVNSRAMAAHESVTLSDGTVLTESELLESLTAILGAEADNRVWLLESVMRLAPTVGYDHWTLEEYNDLRAYGMEGRPVLEGAALTVENIKADYRLGSDGSALEAASFGLEEWEVAEYLSARSRKIELSHRLETLVNRAGFENFRVLIGIDDSSEEDSIQKNEIAYLRQGLRSGDALLSGVDDLAFKAVTKLYLEETDWAQAQIGAQVRYYGGTEDQSACAYDYKPLTEIMAEHLDFFGLGEPRENLPKDEGCIQILVLTQPADESKKKEYYQALIEDLKACRGRDLPTILIDAGNGAYGTAFHEALTEETELGWLLGYAGFLDMAIVTGTALSHGVARYAVLRQGESTQAMEQAFARTLADSVLKDFCYKNVVREDLLAYIRRELGGSPDNFWQPEIDRSAVQARLEEEMRKSTKAVLKNLERSNLIVSLDQSVEDEGLAGWGGIQLEKYRFPWDRAFEIGMDIRLGDFTKPHKQLFGTYYQ
ncbi:DUF4127 family protein [Oscillibacter sp.]|uniref:DUF4127 family protein n=1 Tax=Oscillibacter sp. TaxID=1945593 RepID=UPI002616B1C7|nr:DUF4127 family protein [Oscillibacter sp.]MDD3346845.1 DUF4127 family protein [Oscillibacter sp.]